MKYILGVFGIIVLLLLVVVFLVRGDSTSTDTTQSGDQPVVLSDYETKPATATLTTYGEVTAEELRRGIKVSVSAKERVFEILEGYEEKVVNRQVFSNNQDAYAVFLSSLNTAGFANETSSQFEDERGVCPLGRRYIYGLLDGTTQVLDTWSTSCAARQGTFGGNASTVHTLFENQIPGYNDLVKDVDL